MVGHPNEGPLHLGPSFRVVTTHLAFYRDEQAGGARGASDKLPSPHDWFGR